MIVPSPVVTRFAPSPTGYLHIGGARTALFNWLYARHCGGRFLVRVEDTDRARSTQEAVDAIFDGLSWLGLEPDEPPLFQFSRADRHREAVADLLAKGSAYRDWLSAEETAADRERANTKGVSWRSPWRDRDPGEGDARQPHVIRFRGPTTGETVVDDLVQGPVRWKNINLDDLVLLRSDGAPTYNLAVVVDDHDMGVTHVIRGDDHLNNAARQSLIYEALGWSCPAFAHIPLIHGPDGAKLSKRHGAQAVGDFAALGYLPEALRNYLARLGWSHGDDEIFTDAQAIDWFDIKDAGRAPARLDWDKLKHVNSHWMRLADDARLAALVGDALKRHDSSFDRALTSRLEPAIALLKDRASTIPQLVEQLAFVTAPRPLHLNEKTRALLNDHAVRERLIRLGTRLGDAQSWEAAALESEIRSFAADEGIGLGAVGPLLRGVLAGANAAPDLGRMLAALGREETLARLKDALSSPA